MHFFCGWTISSQLDEFCRELEVWISAGKVSVGAGSYVVMLLGRLMADSKCIMDFPDTDHKKGLQCAKKKTVKKTSVEALRRTPRGGNRSVKLKILFVLEHFLMYGIFSKYLSTKIGQL